MYIILLCRILSMQNDKTNVLLHSVENVDSIQCFSFCFHCYSFPHVQLYIKSQSGFLHFVNVSNSYFTGQCLSQLFCVTGFRV